MQGTMVLHDSTPNLRVINIVWNKHESPPVLTIAPVCASSAAQAVYVRTDGHTRHGSAFFYPRPSWISEPGQVDGRSHDCQ